MQLLARDIARGRINGGIVITTGLGLSEDGVPLRLPALIVPGLEIIKELKSAGISDLKYVIYQASDFISDTNELSAKKAETNSKLSISYLKRFIEEFFPTIAENVELVAGKQCEIDRVSLNELAKIIETERPAQIARDVRKIERYGERHNNGEKTCFLYAAANIILNGGYGPHYPLDKFIPASAMTIIPMGGAKERPFFNLTAYMSRSTGCSHRIIPLLVQTGEIPTYYPYKKGDVLIGDPQEKIAEFVPPKETAQDFFTLQKLGATIEKLSEITSDLQDKYDYKQGPEQPQNYRHSGWNGASSQL
ncbi:MAG: hypothetical protein PHS57_01030 [Alphaproteobacteria bacterium]|nr:hypothetical protein [Alphaproteobacteria bacterium]